jgi:hypothetical protein
MHLMIDLETLSTRSRAVILSIGAVILADDDIIEHYYVELDAQEQIETYNRHVDVGTIAWWMRQNHLAQRVFQPVKPVSLLTALSGLGHMLPGPLWENVQVWSNGATFDIPIVNSAYADIGGKSPWGYQNERCYRTLKNLFPSVKADSMQTQVEHNALDDALYQALHLRKLLQCVPNTR